MSRPGHLTAFVLRHVCAFVTDEVVRWVENRYSDHGQTLPRALPRLWLGARRLIG